MKKVPKVKKITAEKRIEILQEEIRKKDERIKELERENKILFDMSLKRAKERLEKE